MNSNDILTLVAIGISILTFIFPLRNIRNSYQRLFFSMLISFLIVASIYLILQFTKNEGDTHFFNGPVLFSETFDTIEQSRIYFQAKKESPIWINQRLRYVFSDAPIGDTFSLLGQYECFDLNFKIFPVGEIYDASVNILFRQHSTGWYEIQLRPRHSQLYIFRVSMDQHGNWINEPYTNGIWQSNDKITLGSQFTTIRLKSSDYNKFELYVNNYPIAKILDTQPYPYLRGAISLGVGTGSVGGTGFDFDDITIYGCDYT